METLLTTEVTEDQIDHLGHMNVMYYAQHAQAGARTLASRIGLDADGTLFQPDRYTRHHREQLLGSRLEVRGGVLEVGDDQVRVYEELVNTEADVLAASFILTLEATDPEGASRLPLSDPTRSAAGQLVVELPERGRPRTLTIDDDPISNAPSLEELNERERQVLVMRFGLADGRIHTLEEVGKHFNVTRERIRQLETKALAKLRQPSRARKLEGYLGDA